MVVSFKQIQTQPIAKYHIHASPGAHIKLFNVYNASTCLSLQGGNNSF